MPPVKVKNPTLTDLVLATRTRPTFFAFTPNGNQSVLVLSKTRLTTKQLAGLPKGLPVFRGVCQWEDGKLVFHLGVEPPKLLATQLKTTVKRETALDQVVLTRFSKDLVEDLPAEEPGTGATEGETPPEERRENERAFQERALRLRELATRVKVAMEGLPQGEARTAATDELTQLVRDGRSAIQEEALTAVDEAIEGIEDLLKRLPPAPEPSSGGREVREKLGELSDSVKKALEGRNKTRVASLVEQVRAAIGEEDWKAAGLLLDTLEDEVRLASSESTEEWAGRIDIQRYKRGRILGRGAFGYACMLEPLDPERPLLVAKHPTDKKGEEDLDIERRNYELVGDHPNFLRCAGVRDLPDGRALVIEAVRGRETGVILGELRAAAAPGRITVTNTGAVDRTEAGALSQEEFIGTVQHVLQQLLQAMAHLEEKRLVHGDLKPQNVMIDEQTGDVKVIDLGALAPVGVTRTQRSKDWAPSSNLSEGTSFDIGSIGAIAGRLVTEHKGQPPVTGELKKFLDWLTDKTPGHRPSAKEALAHPFLRDRLLDAEQARRVLKGQVRRHQDRPVESKDDELGTFEVTPGLTAGAFDASIEAARQKGYAPDPTLVEEVQTLLRAQATLPDPWDLVRAGKDPTADIERARKLLDAVETRLVKLGHSSTGALKAYFNTLVTAIQGLTTDRKLRAGRHEATTSGFAARWTDVRATLEAALTAVHAALSSGGAGVSLDTPIEDLASAEDDLREAETNLADARQDGGEDSDLESLEETLEEAREKVDDCRKALEGVWQRRERFGLGKDTTIDAYFDLPPGLPQAFADIDRGLAQPTGRVVSGVQRGDRLDDAKRAAVSGLTAGLNAIGARRHEYLTSLTGRFTTDGDPIRTFSRNLWPSPLRAAELRLQDLLRSVKAL